MQYPCSWAVDLLVTRYLNLNAWRAVTAADIGMPLRAIKVKTVTTLQLSWRVQFAVNDYFTLKNV